MTGPQTIPLTKSFPRAMMSTNESISCLLQNNEYDAKRVRGHFLHTRQSARPIGALRHGLLLSYGKRIHKSRRWRKQGINVGLGRSAVQNTKKKAFDDACAICVKNCAKNAADERSAANMWFLRISGDDACGRRAAGRTACAVPSDTSRQRSPCRPAARTGRRDTRRSAAR